MEIRRVSSPIQELLTNSDANKTQPYVKKIDTIRCQRAAFSGFCQLYNVPSVSVFRARPAQTPPARCPHSPPAQPRRSRPQTQTQWAGPCLGDLFAHTQTVVAAQLETRDRVTLKRVQTQRHHQRLRAKLCNPLQSQSQRSAPLRKVTTRQRGRLWMKPWPSPVPTSSA